MTHESEQDTVSQSSSSSTNVEQSNYYEEITKLRPELIVLKSFIVEQLHFIKPSVHEPFEVEKNSQQDNYIPRLLEDINYLKQENKTKSSIINWLIQSGNTNNYGNVKSYRKSSNNDENNNSGTENFDINTHIPNDDSNITIRCRKNKTKSFRDKSKYINKDKSSNKINSKNDNNKYNTKNKYNKSSESRRSGLNDTINTINTSTFNQRAKVSILGDSIIKNVNGFLLTKNLNHKCLVRVRPFRDAKVRCLHDYAKPTMHDFNPNQIIHTLVPTI